MALKAQTHVLPSEGLLHWLSARGATHAGVNAKGGEVYRTKANVTYVVTKDPDGRRVSVREIPAGCAC